MKTVLVYVLVTISTISLLFGQDGISNQYYNSTYDYSEILCQNDTSIKDISVLRSRLPLNSDTSLLLFSKMEYLDYHQLDKVLSYVWRKRSNVLNLNTSEIELSFTLWLLSAYRDQSGRLNALIRVISEQELMFFSKCDLDNSEFPTSYLNCYSWKSDWNDSMYPSTLFLITDIENGCTSKQITNTTKTGMKSNFPEIVYLDSPTIEYPILYRSDLLEKLSVDIEKVQKDYFLNYRTNYKLTDNDLIQLKKQNNDKKLLKNQKLFANCTIDRYGRIDVELYEECKGKCKEGNKRAKKYAFFDLYNTLPKCD